MWLPSSLCTGVYEDASITLLASARLPTVFEYLSLICASFLGCLGCLRLSKRFQIASEKAPPFIWHGARSARYSRQHLLTAATKQPGNYEASASGHNYETPFFGAGIRRQ